MVQLNVKNSTSYAQNVRIKKGYYPAKVLSINVFKDKDDKIVEKSLKDGTICRQLLLKFAVYFGDQETGKPTKPVPFTYKAEGGASITEDVTLANFVFYEYEKKDGTINSAITPKTNAGKLFIALGYDFASNKPLSTDDYVGKWVELNVDDYEKTDETGNQIIKSIIKDVKKYTGPEMVQDKAEAMTEEEALEEIDVIDA